jgi:hypothetical protein
MGVGRLVFHYSCYQAGAIVLEYDGLVERIFCVAKEFFREASGKDDGIWGIQGVGCVAIEEGAAEDRQKLIVCDEDVIAFDLFITIDEGSSSFGIDAGGGFYFGVFVL